MLATRSSEFLPVTPLIAAHVLSGLVAIVVGVIAMRTVKGSRAHRRAGLAYLAALLSLSLTAMRLVVEDWSHRWHLAALALVALGLATIGYAARLRQNEGWKSVHIVGMSGSYMAMLTAFYVDNGPRLPVWRDLPPVLLWVIPWLVGVPIMLRAVRRYRRSVK